MRSSSICRRLSGVALLALALHGGVASAAAPPVVAAALEVDRAVRRADPVPDAVPVYLSMQAEDLTLREVSISVDAQPFRQYRYSDAQSAALQAGASHRLGALPNVPGTHAVSVELVARKVGASAVAPRVVQRFKADISYTGTAPAVLIEWSGGGMFSGADTQLRVVAADASYRARHARFLQASGWPLLAVFEYDAARPLAAADALAAAELMQSFGLAGAAPLPAAADPAAAGAAAVPATGRASVQRYNAALAMLAAGDTGQGMAELEALAGTEWTDAASMALRDLCNLTLGYRYLHQREAEAAVEAFRRVRSPGPYSDRALLGLGWAYVLPVGAGAEREVDDSLWVGRGEDGVQARRRMPFRYAWSVAGGERAEDLRQALVPWTELIGGDPLSVAVQEGMLALPYLMWHLGAHEQAQRYALRAVDALEQTHAQLDQASTHVRSGALLAALFDAPASAPADDWSWHLARLQYDDDTAYLQALLTDTAFTAALDRLRQLHAVRSVLTADRVRAGRAAAADAGLQRSLDHAEAELARSADAAAQQLQQAALSVLTRLQQRATAYLVEAHFALASRYDLGPDPQLAAAEPSAEMQP
ncbi:MAG: hypothetical protein PHP86_00985 [Nevskiales bacterium]|nr:hypothetical protein [Nevskiales bacterium]